MKNFQIVSLFIFGVLAVFGMLVFSGAIPIGNKEKDVAEGTVTFWGPFDGGRMSEVFSDFNRDNRTFTVRYQGKDPATYKQQLLEAFASGRPPDLFMLPSDFAYDYRDKVYVASYESYPLIDFRNIFAGAGEVFATSKGIMAIPFAIDPLVMYYNRSILDSSNIVYPPSFWDDFLELVPKLTEITEDRQIVKSAVALGQFSNIQNAKDILSSFFFQAGSPIILENNLGFFNAVLGDKKELLGTVLSFYTDFANPLKTTYSWNRSLPNSQDYFSFEKSAFYFGFASEYETLINKNPNQDLAVASLPQIKGTNTKATGARVLGIAVSPNSKNLNTAFIAASLIANGNYTEEFVHSLGLVPARRDLLNKKPEDAFLPVFYQSALFAKSWLDPDPIASSEVFRQMVEELLSNASRPESAVSSADGRLQILLIR